MRPLAAILPALALLAGCSMEPKYARPAMPVPASWPRGEAYLPTPDAALPAYSWRDVFTDPRLQAVIERALANNQDAAIAAANVNAARAQYHVQRAELLPELDASASYRRSGDPGRLGSGGTGAATDSFTVEGSVASWEIDLFGRLRSLAGASKDRYMASGEALRGTRQSLVSDVATAWLSLGADNSALLTAKDTADAAAQSLKLTRARLDAGVAPRSDVRQAEIVLGTAQADVASLTTQVAQDRNALRLLVGADLAESELPSSIDDAEGHIGEVAAGLDSAILLRRPDVLQAEWQLRAANAQVGAARAALFPKITLTGLLGFASGALGSLFDHGNFGWQGGASASYPIISGGAGKASLQASKAQRDAALGGYRKAIESAFTDVANVLARRGTIERQLGALRSADAAAEDNLKLADLRYRSGITSYLADLTARQARYSAARSLITARLLRATNKVALYRALGGDSTLADKP